MHVIHLKLTAFIEQHDGSPIYVAGWVEVDTSSDNITSHLFASYQSNDVLHLVHLRVERATLADRQIIEQRLEQARGCLVAALPHDHDVAREGLVMIPEIWEKLLQFRTDHDLWSWKRDGFPPRERSLIPR